MFDSPKFAPKDEEDMEDFHDYEDEEHTDGKLDEYDDSEDDEDDDEEEESGSVETPAPSEPEPVASSLFAESVMPAPPPRSPVATAPRAPRFLIAAVILLAILIGIVALFLTQNTNSPRISRTRTVAQVSEPWGILGG